MLTRMPEAKLLELLEQAEIERDKYVNNLARLTQHIEDLREELENRRTQNGTDSEGGG